MPEGPSSTSQASAGWFANARLRRPNGQDSDLIAGLTNSIAGIPDRMASGVIMAVLFLIPEAKLVGKGIATFEET
jgi:hypothetical protein